MNTKKYILAAATLLGLAACQQEESLTSAYDTDPNAVKISASIAGVASVQTRINTDGEGVAWTNDDMICVTNVSSNVIVGKTKAIYTYTTETGWALSGADYMVWADGVNTFNAYYPYESGNATTSFTAFTLPNDQSDIAKISKADWMLATATDTKSTSDKAVNLEFAHQFAKVTVKIAAYNNEFVSLPGIADVDAPKFTLPTTPATITGKTVTVQGNSTTIAALKVEDASDKKQHSFTSVLLPGTYSAGTDFFQFAIGSTTYKAKVNSMLTTGIEGGKAYTFSLTVGKDMITIGSVTVEDWAASDWTGVGGGGTAEEVQP